MVMNSLHFYLMSQVDPKVQEISKCLECIGYNIYWLKANDNGDTKWELLLTHIKLEEHLLFLNMSVGKSFFFPFKKKK